MNLIKSTLQRSMEYFQIYPEKPEGIIGLIHAYSFVCVIKNKKKDFKKINKIFKACLKIPKEQRAWKIKKFTVVLLSEIGEFVDKLKVKNTFISEYEAIDFTEDFDVIGTEIPYYE